MALSSLFPKGVFRADAARKVIGLDDLPVELLVDIFSWLVALDAAHAIKVSHVCAHWRTVILDAPSLWNTLVLCSGFVVEKTETWIRRSDGHIRELCVAHLPNSYLHDCITALHMINWDHIRILRVHAIVTHLIMKCLEAIGKLDVIPNLDDEILSDDRVYAKVATPFLRRFHNSNLRSLTIRGIWLEDVVPTPKLEVLILSDVVLRYKALRSFLAANPMLQKIVADCDIENISWAANKTSCLSRLTHLGVSREATKLFRHIAMPSLEVLHISYGLYLDVYIHSFRNPIMLTELSIVQSRVAVTPFLQFLQQASSLKSLQLSIIDGFHLDLVASVVETLTHRLICPSLTYFAVSSSYVSRNAFKYFIEARLTSIQAGEQSAAMRQIETLVIDDCPNIDPETLRWLRAHVKSVSCSRSDEHEGRNSRLIGRKDFTIEIH